MRQNIEWVLAMVFVAGSISFNPPAHGQGSHPPPVSTEPIVELELRAEVPGLIPDGGGEIRVEIPGLGMLERPGRPQLPWEVIEVALPPDVSAKDIKLQVETQPVVLPGRHRVIPSPPFVFREEGEPEVYDWQDAVDLVDGYDRAVYDSNEPYPSAPVEIIGGGRLRQWRYVKLAFYPVRYIPSTGELIHHRRVTVRLQRSPSAKALPKPVQILPDPGMDTESTRRFVNVDQAEGWYRSLVPRVLDRMPTDYVIVTTRAIANHAGDSISEFVEHKRRLGHRVRVVTEEDYGHGSGGHARVEKIRAWLQNNYLSLGIRWVLLIGDPTPDPDPASSDDSVPMLSAHPGYRGNPEGSDSPTDYYYADLSGDWDLDGDGLYAEDLHKPNAIGPEGQELQPPFSIRWRGDLRMGPGSYKLRTLSDDGLRLWLDGDQVIDHWLPHGPDWREYELPDCRQETCSYPLRLDYRRDSGDGVARLYWEAHQRPMVGVGPDHFAVRWKGRLWVDEPGEYSIRAHSDDGIRLYLWPTGDPEPAPIIDQWNNHAKQLDEVTVDLSAGTYELRLEYYEATRKAIIRLEWQRAGKKATVIPSDHLQYQRDGQWQTGGLLGEYFESQGDDKFHTHKGERIDPVIDFNWRLVDSPQVVPKEMFVPAPCDGLTAEYGLCGEYFADDTLSSRAWSRIDKKVDAYWGIGENQPDGVDLVPEVYVGRVPVYNRDYAELAHILNKIQAYEQASTIPAWRRRALLPMDPLDSTTVGYLLGEALKSDVLAPHRFEVDRVYEEDFGLHPPPERYPCSQDHAIELWREGQGLVTFAAHGGSHGSGAVLKSDRCTELDDSRPSFVVQISCSNGRPEEPNNLGYRLLHHGGLATFSGSRNLGYVVAAWDKPKETSGDTRQIGYHVTKRLAGGEAAGRALYETQSKASSWWTNNLRLNLYGDPASSLFRPYQGDKLDIVLVLDRSGSMNQDADSPGSDSKIVALGRAVDQALEILDRDAGHRLGVIGFNARPEVLVPLLDFGQAQAIRVSNAVDRMRPEGKTSIGGGLEAALSLWSGAPGDARRVVLLVTDGKQNEAPWIADVRDDLGDVEVFALGLGHSHGIDEELLVDLAIRSGGDYRVSSDDLIFRKFLVEMLGGAAGWQVITDPTYTLAAGKASPWLDVPVTLDAGVLVLTAFWSGSGDGIDLEILRPGGAALDRSDPGVHWLNGDGFVRVRVELGGSAPSNAVGSWKLRARSAQDITRPLRTSVSTMVRSELSLRALSTTEAVAAGESVPLNVELTRGGRPVSGLEVEARYARPERGFGDVMHDHRALRLPTIEQKLGVDPPSPLERRVEALRARLGDAFMPTRDGSLRLYDDGRHHDGGAGDGVYGGLLKDTRVPGTYRIRYFVENSEGSLGREWGAVSSARVIPDAAHSDLVVSHSAGMENTYHLRVIPRDRFGNHLGPGYLLGARITGSGRKVMLEDQLDGSYLADVQLTAAELAARSRFEIRLRDETLATLDPAPSWQLAVRLGISRPEGGALSDYDAGASVSLELARSLRSDTWIWANSRYAHLNSNRSTGSDLDLTMLAIGLERRQASGGNRLRTRQRAAPVVFLPDFKDPDLGVLLGFGLSWELKKNYQLTLDSAYQRAFSGSFELVTVELGLALRF